MGKHERGKVERAERDACARINGEDGDPDHELAEEAEALANRLSRDFDIKQCEHVGNEYGDALGDLVLHTSNGKEYIEAKFLDPSSNSGTRANIGGDSLTKYGLFKGNPQSWSEFRQEQGFDNWRLEKLNEFDYPEGIESVSEKAGHLKDVIGVKRGQKTIDVANDNIKADSSPKEEHAARIVKKIYERSNRGIKEYIRYLLEFEQNENSVKKFTLLILCGAHTRTAIEERWSLDEEEIIDVVNEGYQVYYVFKKDCDVDVELEDHHDELQCIADERLFLTSKENQKSILVSFKDGKRRDILRMIHYWGNKFQGIETPRINIFKAEFLN